MEDDFTGTAGRKCGEIKTKKIRFDPVKSFMLLELVIVSFRDAKFYVVDS